jgi:hypothetical protein
MVAVATSLSIDPAAEVYERPPGRERPLVRKNKKMSVPRLMRAKRWNVSQIAENL